MTAALIDLPEPGDWRVGDSRSITHTFTLEELNAFANLTGDINPLHVEESFANRSLVGGQVVHGMLAASFVSTLIGIHIPGRGALWNSFQISWRKTIRIGDSLHIDARVRAIQVATRTLDLDITGVNESTEELYFEGKARVMTMDEPRENKTSGLSGKRVLVTGASGAIGGAICKALSMAGCQLILWGRDANRLQQLKHSLGEHKASVHVVDLLNDLSIGIGLERLLTEGGVDGVVHAAAAPLNFAGIDSELNHQFLIEHLQVEVIALEIISRTLAKTIKPGGFIIAILTQAILDAPPPKMSAYVTAKTAAWGLVRAMAVEFGPRGIRCNAVSPNMVDTPYIKNMPIRTKQVEAASNPMRRLCSAADVASAVEFLAGPNATYINGINFPVSGGGRMP